MSLPSVDVVRERIETIESIPIQRCFQATYLFCARIGEIISLKCQGDNYGKTSVRGSLLNFQETEYRPDLTNFDEVLPLMGNLILQGLPANLEAIAKIREPTVVFTVSTQKRKGKLRYVALPLNPKYEPWTQQLLAYFKEQKKEGTSIFPFKRQDTWRVAKEAFKDLNYRIEAYLKQTSKDPTKGEYKTIRREDGSTYYLLTIPTHTRKFNQHALRHLRDSELINYYGFKGAERSAYGGWTLAHTEGVSASEDRYAEFLWRRYFPKLLKQRQ